MKTPKLETNLVGRRAKITMGMDIDLSKPGYPDFWGTGEGNHPMAYYGRIGEIVTVYLDSDNTPMATLAMDNGVLVEVGKLNCVILVEDEDSR